MTTTEEQQAINTYHLRAQHISCRGCHRIFTVRGLIAHQTARFVAMGCRR